MSSLLPMDGPSGAEEPDRTVKEYERYETDDALYKDAMSVRLKRLRESLGLEHTRHDILQVLSIANETIEKLQGKTEYLGIMQTLSDHQENINAVAFSPDGKWLATGSDDMTIQLRNAATGDKGPKLTLRAEIHAVVFSPDSKSLAAVLDNNIVLCNPMSGRIRELDNHQKIIKTVAFSPNGNWMASGSEDKTILLWNDLTGHPEVYFKHNSSVTTLAFSSDDKRLVSGSADVLTVWDITTREVLQTFENQGRIYALSFSHDGKRLAQASYNTIVVWAWDNDVIEPLTKITLTVARPPPILVTDVVFSPNGKLIVAASRDGMVTIWGSMTGVLRQTLDGHQGERVNAVAFSQNGELLASVSHDRTVKLWTTANSEGPVDA